MNKRMILYIIGKLLIVVALLMVLPLIASIIYHFTNGENLNLLAFVPPRLLISILSYFIFLLFMTGFHIETLICY